MAADPVRIASVAALVAGQGVILPGGPVAEQLTDLLTRRGASREAVQVLLRVATIADVPTEALTASQRLVQEQNELSRAAYLVSASKRITADIAHRRSRGASPAEARVASAKRERAYFRSHVHAQDARRMVARQVDSYAEEDPDGLVGWYAELDGKTTLECRAAHGTNFSPLSPPMIGLPGSLHAGNCRCSPGPAWPEGKLTNTVLDPKLYPRLTKDTRLSNVRIQDS